MERTAIFPGSFDPFTRGHAALVDEALNLFDRVIIGIGNNTSKPGLLTVENRKRLIDDIYRGDERVEACIYTGLTGEFAEAAGACAIIRGVRIGDNTTLYPGVKIYEGCIVGANCILHAGAVIGADGFGFMPNAAGGFDKIPQLGNVVIEDDVEIGANTCIDRAKTDSTVIRRGVKLDNLIQIGHNVQIGENTVSSAQTGIAGTSKVGRNCFLAGQVGIADHVTIGDRVKVGSKSGLDKNVPDDEIRFGYPALPGMQYHRSAAVFKRLPELAQQVPALEKQLAELTKK